MKQDRLTIRLDADIRAKLHAKAAELGLDDAAYARMLIFRDINGVPNAGSIGQGDRWRPDTSGGVRPAGWDAARDAIGGEAAGDFVDGGLDTSHIRAYVDTPRASARAHRSGAYSGEQPFGGAHVDDGVESEVDDGLRAEEMDIPADPDGGVPHLDAILGAAPSILDEMMSGAMPTSQAASTYRQQRQSSRSYRQRPAQPLYGPGSMTRAIGVNDMTIGGNTFGDGTGNVMRDNMRHFGIVGTRAR